VKSCVKILCEELIDIFQTVLIMENPQRKRLWIRKWLTRRNTHGASNMLLKELATEDIEECKNCMRMSPACFETLLKKISSIIQQVDTTMRPAIPAKSYLATGNSFRNLQQQFRVSRPAISNFIPDALKEFIQVRTLYHLFTQNLNQ
jgi:hypothetical protein